MHSSLVSICIPTYQRHKLLGEAIDSCLQQTYKNIEVLVSDDSKDDVTEDFVKNTSLDRPIRYWHNKPRLGQANNVNQLFTNAKGDRLILLHDDDLLLPDAVENLVNCWDSVPNLVACFGKQYIVDSEGSICLNDSHNLNHICYRDSKHIGIPTSALWSALVGQFPNNGYLILTEAARSVCYSDTPEVGDACDYDFGLRLAQQYGNFYFLNTYTAKYRLTPVSISQTDSTGDLAFDLVRTLDLPASLEPTRESRLKRYAVPAVSRNLRLGKTEKARKIFWSRSYPFQQRLTLKGFLQLALLVVPKSISQRLLKLARLDA